MSLSELDGELDREIEKRESSGKRIGNLLRRELPKGLTFEQFVMRPEVEAFDLDFIRCSSAYDAYKGRKRANS